MSEESTQVASESTEVASEVVSDNLEAVEGELTPEVSDSELSEPSDAEVTEDVDPNTALYEVKVDGESIKVTLDEMMKGFQLGSAAHKKFQEAARAQKEARQLEEMLKTNPIEAAFKAGVSPQAMRELMEKYLYDQIKYEELSPEQRELEDLRRFKAEQEQQRQAQKEQEQKAQQQKEIEYYQTQYVASYEAALQKAGIPKSETAVSRIAQIQLDALENGWEMPVEMAVDQFASEQRSLVDKYIESLTEDQVEQVLGKDRLKAIRKKELAKLKNPVSSNTRVESNQQQQKTEKISASDFFSNLR